MILTDFIAGSGRNLNASPEPPPPPPRNQHPAANGADGNGSSFNDSKDSNEISEAECDQPRAISGILKGLIFG